MQKPTAEQLYHFLGWLNGHGYAVVDRDLVDKAVPWFTCPDGVEIAGGYLGDFDAPPALSRAFEEGYEAGKAGR